MASSEHRDTRLPVVVLTGGPGSGKTTVLNRLLTELDEHAVPAVITHRFAREFALDVNPVLAREPAFRGEMFDFGSGCVCCSPTGELLQHLLATHAPLNRTDASAEGGADVRATHVFIETTGLAEPALFVRLLSTHPELCGFRLAALVALVDTGADHPLGPPGTPAHARMREHVRAADLVLLAGEHESTTIVGEALDGAETPVYRASDVRLSTLLAADAKRSVQMSMRDAVDDLLSASAVSLGGHDSTFGTMCMLEDGAIRAERFDEWRRGVVALCASGEGLLLRVKGVVTVVGEPPCSMAAAGDEADADAAATDSQAEVDQPPSRRFVVEWARSGAEVGARPLLAAALARAAPPARSLGHSLVAGIDAPVGTCKVFVCGQRLRVNELRAQLWEAMVPPGFELAAEIEVDLPLAWKYAQRAAAPRAAPPAADGPAAQPSLQHCALRLESWLGAGRDALLVWVEGAFAALADFDTSDAGTEALPSGEGARWAMEAGSVVRLAADQATDGAFALHSPDGRDMIDLKTGWRIAVAAHHGGESGAATVSTSGHALQRPLPMAGGVATPAGALPAVRVLALEIVGGSVYVSKTAADPPPRASAMPS